MMGTTNEGHTATMNHLVQALDHASKQIAALTEALASMSNAAPSQGQESGENGILLTRQHLEAVCKHVYQAAVKDVYDALRSEDGRVSVDVEVQEDLSGGYGRVSGEITIETQVDVRWEDMFNSIHYHDLYDLTSEGLIGLCAELESIVSDTTPRADA